MPKKTARFSKKFLHTVLIPRSSWGANWEYYLNVTHNGIISEELLTKAVYKCDRHEVPVFFKEGSNNVFS